MNENLTSGGQKTENIQKKRKFYNPFYFIWLSIQSIWRNRIMSIASVLVLTSCLVLLGCFGLLAENLDLNLNRLRMLNEMVVFADYDLDGESINRIFGEIAKLENVKNVEYVSKDEALEDMRKTYSEYPELFDSLKENGDNPLADSFIVTYRDNSVASELEYNLHTIDGVRKVNNRLDLANDVEGLKSGVSVVFIWFFVLLLLVSLFVIFNTVKLAVHSRRAEIVIMRYIGATKAFIVAPFIIEGVILGLISAIVAFFANCELYKYAVKLSAEKLKMLEFVSFSRYGVIMLVGFIALGVSAGITASLLSLRKNLSQ